MSKAEESIVQKPRQPFEDILLRENTDELARFMEQPTVAIAEALTGALAAEPKSWMVMGGHIVQGILKAKLFQQVSQEIRELRDKGKIPNDFADEKKYKYGFKSWVELFTVIDEDPPDADRLEALKAMFYNVNKVNAADGERIASYQLFQVSKKLTSGQLLYLKACFTLLGNSGAGYAMDISTWLNKIGQKLGHDVIGLLEQDDDALAERGLLTPRIPSNRDQVMPNNARLTPLGVRFCRNIEEYRTVVPSDTE